MCGGPESSAAHPYDRELPQELLDRSHSIQHTNPQWVFRGLVYRDLTTSDPAPEGLIPLRELDKTRFLPLVKWFRIPRNTPPPGP